MKRIINFLNISQDTYNTVLFDTGMEKLEAWLGEKSRFVPLVSQLPAYWAWYQNQFELIDETFMNQHNLATGPRSRAHLVEQWKAAHAAERLVAFPRSKAIDKEIAAFVGQSIDIMHREVSK